MTPYFFGYGSLVNRNTHDYPDARPATLQGWRRAWVHTPARAAVYLSVVRDAACEIDGLIAAVPDADWAALDLREAAYARVSSGGAVRHTVDPAPDISHYTVTDLAPAAPQDACIVLSYLDIVAQGFLREYGRDGLARFFDTTAGWDTPILNDRADPRYPRYHQLARAEEILVEEHLEAVSARILPTVPQP